MIVTIGEFYWGIKLPIGGIIIFIKKFIYIVGNKFVNISNILLWIVIILYIDDQLNLRYFGYFYQKKV